MRHSVVVSGYGGATSGSSFGSGNDGVSAGAVVGSTAGTAAGVAGSSAGGTGGSAVGPGVAVSQSGQDGQVGPDYITMSDLILFGTVEGATHAKARASLLRSVAGLPAEPLRNLVGTFRGNRDFNIDDWGKIGAACKAGGFDLGFLDKAGYVQAMFQSDGKAWVKAINADGSLGWVKLTNPSRTSSAESPETIENRLEAIAKAAITPIDRTQFLVTDNAWLQYTVTRVLENGSIQVENPVGYAGVKAWFPGQQFWLVATGRIPDVN